MHAAEEAAGPTRTMVQEKGYTRDNRRLGRVTVSSNSDQEGLRQGFRIFNRFMVGLWRLGLGSWVNSWPSVGGRILVLVHSGRKTGARRLTPVNYAMVGGDLYCVAGFGPRADWYQNILVQPQIEVWLPNGWWQAVAEDVSDSRTRLPVVRQVLIASGFVGRLAGLDAQRITDAALHEATAPYRLVRLRLIGERTGAGGPGSLAWVWPTATFLLLIALGLR